MSVKKYSLKNNYGFLLLMLMIILIIGCAAFTQYGKLEKSARQNYQQGKYDTAFYQCANSLKMKPTYDKAQLLIQDAFRTAVVQHESSIKQLKSSSSKFRWDDVVSHYNELIKINQTAKTLPTLTVKKTKEIIKFDTKDFSKEIAEGKTNAAEAHYQEGDRLSKISNLDNQKQAAKEFKAAERFVLGYKDASTRYDTCRKAGIKRMAIIPFENKSGKTQYGAIEEMITDDIISNVMSDPSAMEFLEIISRDQLLQVMNEQKLGLSGVLDDQTAVQLGKVLGVHELLTGKITQIAYTQPRTATSKYQDEENVPLREEKYVDSKGKTKTKTIWGKVNATITKHVKTASTSINGSYKIVDVSTARIKKSESFKGSSNFNFEWGEAYGDERALSKYSKGLISKTESFPPGAEEMVNDAARDLSNSLASTLKAYAR